MKSIYSGLIVVTVFLCLAGCGKKDASTELMPLSGPSNVKTFTPADVVPSKDPEHSKKSENTKDGH